jgi:hypothetical protein
VVVTNAEVVNNRILSKEIVEDTEKENVPCLDNMPRELNDAGIHALPAATTIPSSTELIRFLLPIYFLQFTIHN